MGCLGIHEGAWGCSEGPAAAETVSHSRAAGTTVPQHRGAEGEVNLILARGVFIPPQVHSSSHAGSPV